MLIAEKVHPEIWGVHFAAHLFLMFSMQCFLVDY